MSATPSAMPTAERHTLRAGELIASYYTCEPGPQQWIAVATIAPRGGAPAARALRLLVGSGDSEAAAIEHLHRRLFALDA